MLELSNKTIAVTGANSMVGKSLIRYFEERNVKIQPVYHEEHDLMDYKQAKMAIWGADYCFHCAGYNGNIDFNKKYPADIFYRTSQMALNVLTACREKGIVKVVSPLASCAYPNEDILKEEDFLNGSPHPTVEAHGLSKRIIQAYSRQLKKQYGFNSVCVIFNTCYGPHDSFDVDKTKVVGGLIKKIHDAKKLGKKSITCWGTGKPRREFVYVDDASLAMVHALTHYEDCYNPLNIGSGKDVSVKELATLIANILDYKGEILWDTSKPDGQYRKLLDISTLEKLTDNKEFPKIALTNLKDGLIKTIEWWTK